jgi:hypothetical protein
MLILSPLTRLALGREDVGLFRGAPAGARPLVLADRRGDAQPGLCRRC